MTQPERSNRLSRRVLFAGAGTVGAIAAVSAVVPLSRTESAASEPTPRKPPARGGGYVLSEHVKRYYRTART